MATVSSHVMKYLKFSVLLKEMQSTSTNNILKEICDCFFLLFIYICIVICEPIIIMWGPSWSWSYGSWIYNYRCTQCILPLMFFFIWILFMTIQHYVINFVYITNDHRYVPLVVSTCRSFSRSWLITRVTRQVSLVEQELSTLLEHLSSLPVFREVNVARSLVFCVMFCRSLFVLVSFIFWPLCCLSFFDLQILITPLASLSSSCQWFRQVGDFLWVPHL